MNANNGCFIDFDWHEPRCLRMRVRNIGHNEKDRLVHVSVYSVQTKMALRFGQIVKQRTYSVYTGYMCGRGSWFPMIRTRYRVQARTSGVVLTSRADVVQVCVGH